MDSITTKKIQDGSESLQLLRKDATHRVDLGTGTFLVLFFGVCYIFSCCIALLLIRPCRIYIISTFSYGIILLLLFKANRESDWSEDNLEDDMNNDIWYWRFFIKIFLIFSCCFGCIGLTSLHLTQNIYANELELMENQRSTSRPLF